LNKLLSYSSLLSLVLGIGILLIPSTTEASAALTRGEFFELLSDYVELSPENQEVSLPVDVEVHSPDAERVQALIERNIIYGYPDGTIRLRDVVKPKEVEYILARFLGISDQEAIEKMKTEFQISRSNNDFITRDQAHSIIKTVLENDPTLIQYLDDVMNDQLKTITAFTVSTQQTKKIHLDHDVEPIKSMEAKSQVSIHKDQGYHLNSVVQYSAKNKAKQIELEQYMVPDGLYIRMKNSGKKDNGTKSKWIQGTDAVPFQYDQKIISQLKSSIPEQLINKRYYFYRSLGIEEIKGQKIHKIQIFGSMPLVANMNELQNTLLGNSHFSANRKKSTDKMDLNLSINGTVYIDVQTNRLMEAEWVQTVRNDEQYDRIPFKQIEVETKMQYSEYNQVKPIILPDEVIKAKSKTTPSIQKESFICSTSNYFSSLSSSSSSIRLQTQ
jgi:S-layer homology domain